MTTDFGKCTHCGAIGNSINLLNRSICGAPKCEAKRDAEIRQAVKRLGEK